MPYSGSGKNTYWASIGYNGTSAPGILSEKIPVVVDGLTLYYLNVSATPDNATWASGYRINLNFYDVNGSSTGSAGFATSGSLTAGVLTTLTTTPLLAPANSVTCQAQVEYIGAPATTNPLRVYEAEVYTTGNSSQPDRVNSNYVFVHTTDPWITYNAALLDWNFDPLDGGDGDFDSLIIDDLIELMGGGRGVESVMPELVDPVGGFGAIYRIHAPGGVVSPGSGPYDLGMPQPTADVVESLLLDGERPFGKRASNRTVSIPIVIFAPTLGTLAAAREILLQTIDQQTWKLTWRPAETGLPMDLECFRANASVVTYGFNYNRPAANSLSPNPANWALSVVNVSFQAMPYGKSGQDGIQAVDFTDGILDAGTVAASQLIDDFSSPQFAQDFQGGTNGVTISTGNSGSTGRFTETAFSAVTLGGTATATYSNAQFPAGSTQSAAIGSGASSSTPTLRITSSQLGHVQYFRLYVRMASYPAAKATVLRIADSGNNTLGRVTISTAGKVGMDSATATDVIVATNAIPTSTWARISGFISQSTSLGQVGFSAYWTNTEGSAADDTKLSASNLNTGSGNPNFWEYGSTSAVLNFSYNLGNIACGSVISLGPATFSGLGTTTSPGGGKWAFNSAYSIVSTQSVRYSAPVPMKMPWAAAQYSATNLSLNLSGLKAIYTWFGQSYDTQWTTDRNFKSNVTLAWTLTDINSKTLSFSGTFAKCPWGADPNKPVWTRISAAIPQGKTKAQFDYSRVTAYKVRITNWAGSGTTGYVRMHAWLSRAIAVGGSTKWIDTPHGRVYSMFGLNGMARSPLSATVQLPAQNPVTQELTQTGTWIVPKGVTSVQAEAWGGGGGGGSVSGIASGMAAGGGGGGEYAAEAVVATIPGTKVPVTIGAGGSGGQVINRTVTFTRPGNQTWTCPANVTTATADMWGGGAAGAAGSGGGGGGTYVQGTINVTPGTTYMFTVGKGGTPNTGTLSRDIAARHGGDTVVRGDGYSLHAPGGSSSNTGGSAGGTGGVLFSGTGTIKSFHGGNGGNSPGGAGGGGGAAGDTTANGGRGGDSLRGANNYATGGAGGLASQGGDGGKGADIGGTPAKGMAPGGGGGGGYTLSTNYVGAAGGNGQITLTYAENLGNPINGGTTLFGSSALTNKVVTANGGSSPALSSATGGNGGTGSSNTTHFNGGKGAMSGNNNDYLYRVTDNGSVFFKQVTTNATSATVTTGTASTTQTTGLSIVTVLTSTFSAAKIAVSDSAGNNYDFIGKADLPSATNDALLFVAKVGAKITSGATTVSVNNDGNSTTMSVAWYGTNQYADIDTSGLVIATATSTSPSVTVSNPDIGSRKGFFTFWANNSTASFSAGPNQPNSYVTSDGATSSQFTSGTNVLIHTVKELPGASGTNAISNTYASSIAWTAISLPLIPQDVAEPIPMRIVTTNTTGTTVVNNFTNAFAVPAGRGYMYAICHFAGTPGTVSFTDGPGNTWSQRSSVIIGTSVIRTYSAPVTIAYTTGSTVTLNDGTSQAHNMDLFYIHEANSVDTALDKTNTGTSTAPSISTNTPNSVGDLQMVVMANNNSVDTTAGPSGNFVAWAASGSGTMHHTMYAIRVPARTTYTATGTYAGSQTWGVVANGFTNKLFTGSGGSSGGPLGQGNDGTDSGGSAWEGGGKGANAVTVAGAGAPAAIPGGGGSGAASTDTSAFVGGSGASGMVRLTWQPPLTTFNDLILHRPSDNSKPSLCPLVNIPPNDPPDNREYAVPSLVSGKNAEFNGTYSVLLVANAWNSATTGTARRVSVTVNQYEYTNGPAVSVQATRVVTPATDIVNGYVDMGALTLPIKDYDESNDEVYYTVSVHDTDTGDSFQDVMFLDTAGQTVLVNIAPGTAGDSVYSSFYIDEATFDRSLGQILGSGHDRKRGVSVLDMSMLTGTLYITSGENLLLAYSTGGAPNLGITYVPRWYTDRIK